METSRSKGKWRVGNRSTNKNTEELISLIKNIRKSLKCKCLNDPNNRQKSSRRNFKKLFTIYKKYLNYENPERLRVKGWKIP